MTGNGFPYFQFHIDKWQAGKINAFDLEEQGFYLNLCILAWVSQGAFNVCSTTVQRRYRKPAQWIADTMAAFLEVGIIERDGDKYRIKFIDDQVELLSGKRQQRVDAGKASAAKRALLSSETTEQSKVEKSREEKSSTLNSRSTVVQRSFDLFWAVYPKKVGKKAALKAWEKAKDKPDVADVVNAVQTQAQSQPWKKDGGQYIPNPATWLNEGRWDDQTQLTLLKPRNCI